MPKYTIFLNGHREQPLLIFEKDNVDGTFSIGDDIPGTITQKFISRTPYTFQIQIENLTFEDSSAPTCVSGCGTEPRNRLGVNHTYPKKITIPESGFARIGDRPIIEARRTE